MLYSFAITIWLHTTSPMTQLQKKHLRSSKLLKKSSLQTLSEMINGIFSQYVEL